MDEWLDELWRGFLLLPALAQFLIIFSVLAFICGVFGSYLIWRSFQQDKYRGVRRRGDVREVAEYMNQGPIVSVPDRAHPAFAIRWNGVSGAHRAVDTIEGHTRPLHPGHIAAARARVGQLQDEEMTDDRVRAIGREHLRRLRPPEQGS